MNRVNKLLGIDSSNLKRFNTLQFAVARHLCRVPKEASPSQNHRIMMNLKCLLSLHKCKLFPSPLVPILCGYLYAIKLLFVYIINSKRRLDLHVTIFMRKSLPTSEEGDKEAEKERKTSHLSSLNWSHSGREIVFVLILGEIWVKLILINHNRLLVYNHKHNTNKNVYLHKTWISINIH